jgi:aryl-alcohol dehydrogenase-like predicted oxidoreductase
MLPAKLILGTVQFGMPYGVNNRSGQPTQEQVFDILDLARTAGIQTLDTAEDYGSSQTVIGEYNRQLGDTPGFNIISKLSPRITDAGIVIQNVRQTLSVLQIRSLEGYLFHKFENFIKYPDLLRELIVLRDQGHIKKIGVSVYDDKELAAVLDNSYIDIVQAPFNLLDNLTLKKRFLEEAKSKGKEIHVRSVFLQGLFFMEEQNIPLKIRELWPYIYRAKQIAAEAGVSIEQLALQYVYRNSLVDKVLIGIDSREHLQQSIDSISVSLPEEIFREIDKIVVKETVLLYPINWK